MNSIAEKYIRMETMPFIFCPGCGHGIVVNSFIRAVDELGLTNNDMALVSGIGCSSWSPVYLKFDALHSLHGRAIAQAEGLKVVNPDKSIVVFTGDGDCAGIGGNHMIHAAKRNHRPHGHHDEQLHIRHDRRTEGADHSVRSHDQDLAAGQ